MGKPAKGHQKKQISDHREPLGKKVMCIALGGAIYQCQNPKCYKVVKRGMLAEYDKKLFCGDKCIQESQRVVT